MSNQFEEVREDIEEVKKDQIDAYKVAIKAMEQTAKRERFHAKIYLVIILVLLGVIAYDTYQDSQIGYIETPEEWSQDGDYNIYNKDGSMTNGDIPYGEADLQENN